MHGKQKADAALMVGNAPGHVFTQHQLAPRPYSCIIGHEPVLLPAGEVCPDILAGRHGRQQRTQRRGQTPVFRCPYTGHYHVQRATQKAVFGPVRAEHVIPAGAATARSGVARPAGHAGKVLPLPPADSRNAVLAGQGHAHASRTVLPPTPSAAGPTG